MNLKVPFLRGITMQGFIFFFTAEKLRKSIISVHHSFVMRGQHVTYMILDFRMVDEVDTRNQN